MPWSARALSIRQGFTVPLMVSGQDFLTDQVIWGFAAAAGVPVAVAAYRRVLARIRRAVVRLVAAAVVASMSSGLVGYGITETRDDHVCACLLGGVRPW